MDGWRYLRRLYLQGKGLEGRRGCVSWCICSEYLGSEGICMEFSQSVDLGM